MPNREPGKERESIAPALARTGSCPPLEQLEQLLGDAAAPELALHLENCAHCRTELDLLRAFTAGDIGADEKAAVNAIAARLKASPVIPARASISPRTGWWSIWWSTGWRPVAMALAVILVVSGVAIQLRRAAPPSLENAAAPEVLRSSSLAVISPMGDLREQPAEIRWQGAPGASHYTVQLLEVDRTPLWSADTIADRIELPGKVKALIVPAKTLLCQVTAYDASGHKVAESETVRFRVLQNVYTR